MKKQKEIPAYMTVEVSLLFPTILIILICVIYLIFYSYNRTIAFQNSAICALYGTTETFSDTKEQQVEQMYGILEVLNEGQYIAQESLNQEITVSKNVITVSQTGCINIPVFHSEIMSNMEFLEELCIKEQKAVFYIRQIKKVKSDEI